MESIWDCVRFVDVFFRFLLYDALLVLIGVDCRELSTLCTTIREYGTGMVWHGMAWYGYGAVDSLQSHHTTSVLYCTVLRFLQHIPVQYEYHIPVIPHTPLRGEMIHPF